jgi:hypothetical protein
MATLFSLQDGNLTDLSVYGYSLSAAEIMNNTTGTMLLTSSLYSTNFVSDGSTLTALAVHLSARAADPQGTLNLTLQRIDSSGVFYTPVSETYAISGFTGFDGSDNSVTSYPQNWQILKLTNPLSTVNGDSVNYSLSTSHPDQLSLIVGSSSAVNAMGLPLINRTGTHLLTSYKPYDNFGDSYFLNGTSFFTSPASPKFAFSGDFTIECWINTRAFTTEGNATRRIFTFGPDVANNISVNFWNGSIASSIISVKINSTTTAITGTRVVADGNWHHVAVSRNSNVMRLYVDGLQSGLSASSTTIFNTGTAQGIDIGTYDSSNGRLSAAYINEFRIVNGTAMYTTSSFTVPTAPLEAVPNTVFLMKNGARFDQALITTNSILSGSLTKTGTTLSAISPFGDGVDGSLYFNGTITDGVTVSKPISFAGDFTIECWTYTSNTSGAAGRPIFDNRPNNNNTSSCMYLGFAENSNKLLIDRSAGTRVTVASSSDPFPLNQWVHIAYSRPGRNTKSGKKQLLKLP